MARRRPSLSMACAVSLGLAGCGGGGGSDMPSADTLGDGQAQAYAADAGVMPLGAADGIDAAADELSGALAGSVGAAATQRHVLAAAPLATTTEVSVDCAGGGRIVWTATGASAQELDNGRFDAGEVYAVRYEDCVTAAGRTLAGAATVTVHARSTGLIDLGLVMTGLSYTAPHGRFTLGGEVRRRLERTLAADGSQTLAGRLTASAVTLATALGQREASYTLSSMDWTVSRTLDAAGDEFRRSHQGQLQLAAVTPRRPDASLEVQSEGALTAGDDGLVAAGTLRVANTANEWNLSYGAGLVTITLDFGRDGTIDRRWTLERGRFHGQAG